MEKTYITKYKGLELVHTPMGTKDKQGNKIPSVRCGFKPTTYGYAFSTSNVEIIKWLEQHEYFKDGRIQEYIPGKELPIAPVLVANGVKAVIQETAPTKTENKKGVHTVKINK